MECAGHSDLTKTSTPDKLSRLATKLNRAPVDSNLANPLVLADCLLHLSSFGDAQ